MKAISPGKSNRHLHWWQRETNCKGFWASRSITVSLQLAWRNSATNNTAKQEHKLYPVPVQVLKFSLIFQGCRYYVYTYIIIRPWSIGLFEIGGIFFTLSKIAQSVWILPCFDKGRWPNSLRIKFKPFPTLLQWSVYGWVIWFIKK